MALTICVLHTGHRYKQTGVYLLRTWLVPLLQRHHLKVLQQLLRWHQRKALHKEADRTLAHRAVTKRSSRQVARERGRGTGIPRLNFHERTQFYCRTSREQQKHHRRSCEIISRRTTTICAHIPRNLFSRLVVGNKNLASDKWKRS